MHVQYFIDIKNLYFAMTTFLLLLASSFWHCCDVFLSPCSVWFRYTSCWFSCICMLRLLATLFRFAFSTLIRRCFDVVAWTLFRRRWLNVDSICVFNPFSKSFRRRGADVVSTSWRGRRFDVVVRTLFVATLPVSTLKRCNFACWVGGFEFGILLNLPQKRQEIFRFPPINLNQFTNDKKHMATIIY